MATKKPNILILWGDDIGWWNISYNSRGQMGYRTPNIDRIANEGIAFTDYYMTPVYTSVQSEASGSLGDFSAISVDASQCRRRGRPCRA